MPNITRFREEIAQCPLIAILRGLTPDVCIDIGQAIFEGGISIMEVPLNSPEPLESIERLARHFDARAIIGAGTVLDAKLVPLIASAGGALIVAPNVDTSVIAASVASGLVSLPGYFTPSEAFIAIAAGAHGLKFFPAEAAHPAVLKAQKAVLPEEVPVFVVGGTTPENAPAWRASGADGLGIGSALYRPGDTAAAVHERTRQFVKAWQDG